jgi:hypothetical protein
VADWESTLVWLAAKKYRIVDSDGQRRMVQRLVDEGRAEWLRGHLTDLRPRARATDKGREWVKGMAR